MINVQPFTDANGSDKFALLEAGQLPAVAARYDHRIRKAMMYGGSWYADTYESFARKVNTGDEALVAQSEKVLAELEDQIPMSRGWCNVDDVVGAVPNVPAFLAGHPQHMRRRERTRRDNAPLAVYMDLTCSAGISATDIMRRGCTLLALTRVLLEHRAVELWVGTSVGVYRQSATLAWRIDTTPLDLARSSYHIASVAIARSFGYEVAAESMCHQWNGSWAFGDHGAHTSSMPRRLQRVMPGHKILYVPPIYLGDPMTKDPVGWVKRVLNLNTEEE